MFIQTNEENEWLKEWLINLAAAKGKFTLTCFKTRIEQNKTDSVIKYDGWMSEVRFDVSLELVNIILS